MTKITILLAALLGLVFSRGEAAAADYPQSRVRIIVPFAPGGATDLAARIVGQRLSEKWGQAVIIENRPGAGGIIGLVEGIRAAPDGYTVLMATNGEIVNIPAISVKVRYDSQKDLIPIAMVTSSPFLWGVNVASPIKSLKELVAAAKEKPGTLAYSSAGNGSSGHVATEQFTAAVGIKLLHVPYRGGAPAAAAIVAGDVSVSAIALSSVLSILDTGKVRLLAVTSRNRVANVPDVPTFNETGVVSDFETSIWTGLFAPAGTPNEIVTKIQNDVIEILKEPGTASRLNTAGAQPVGMPGEELKARISREIEQVTEVGKKAGIRLE